MLIENARIHTMVSKTIEVGYIMVRDGIICEVGVGQADPLRALEEEKIDLQGMDVYPGFIDAHTHLGMFENGLTFEGDDGNEMSDPVTPHLRAIDAINPMDRCFEDAIFAGITTVLTGPGSSNPIGGQFAAIKTYGKRIDKMVLKEPACIKFALGENPKNVYNEKNQTPITRMATAALIREQLQKAQRYLDDKLRANFKEGDSEEPEYDAKCEALLPLLRKEIPAHFHAHRSDDIFTAIRIAKEFDLDYVIIHGTEGHLIKEELKEEGTKVLSGPFLCDRSKPEVVNLTPQTPSVLSKEDIPVAIVTDHPVIPIQYLPVCAALAVREGMDRFEALKAITINAAKICQIDDRVGSIEKGKDADFVVFSGDPITFTAKPEMVFCNGKLIK